MIGLGAEQWNVRVVIVRVYHEYLNSCIILRVQYCELQHPIHLQKISMHTEMENIERLNENECERCGDSDSERERERG